MPFPLPKLNSNSNKKNDSDEMSEEEEEEVNPIVDKNIDPSGSFFATFIDGSSFRYLIEYLRMSSTEGTFVFGKDYITYQKHDDEGTIFNNVRIKTYELTDYEFSSFNTEISSTINLLELRNKTRTVGKKEQLDIYRRPEEPTNFYIQVRSQEKGGGDNPVFYRMGMKTQNIEIYELPVFSRGKHNPNCTIYQSDFSKVCKALIANKCSYCEFVGYEKGILIKGFTTDGNIAMVKEYGKCRTSPVTKTSNTQSVLAEKNVIKPQVPPPKLNIRDTYEIEKFKVPISTIKSLAKINGFSASGTLKFYIESGLPMKIVSHIGTYGKLDVLVKSL